MKILHTSDWHIGIKLNGRELDEDHNLFFEWLIDLINKEKIDVLLVAGDIFDIAYPSNAALQLYYKTLCQLQQTNCKQIIIVGGNHDSVSTLNAPKEILESMNIHVFGGVTDNLSDHIIEINDTNGDLGIVIAAIPYLRDRDIRNSIPGETYNERITAMREGIKNFYINVASHTQQYNGMVPVICTGHMFFSGGITSDSERELNIGNLEQVSVGDLPVFDYFALGHLHRPQILAANKAIRYSGSPIPLSFNERNDKKEVVIIETKNNAITNISPVYVPEFRKLILIRGTFADISGKLATINEHGLLKTRISIEIEEDNIVAGLESDLQALIENTMHCEILNYKIRYLNKSIGADELIEQHESLRDIAVEEIFDRLLDRYDTTDKVELNQSFAELISWMNVRND